MCEYKAQVLCTRFAVVELVLSGKDLRPVKRLVPRYQAGSCVNFRTDPLMEPVLQKSRAKMLHIWVFGLTLLALHPVSLKACKDEPSNAEPGGCFNSSRIYVQEGDSINMLEPLKNEHYKVRDLCIWNGAASEWESICHFVRSSGICRPFQSYFKEDIILKGKILMLHNVSRGATGIYKVLDLQSSGSRKCVAWINLTVEEGSSHTNHGISLTDFMFAPMLLLLLVAFCIS